MLVPPEMIAVQSKLIYQMNKYCADRVQARKAQIHKTIQEVCRVVQEPRFISSLNDYNGRYDGLEVVSPTEFEIIIYLNQMGVLNFVDDGTLPGCAVLKLSDGRKRSMSLWVEFITASGYLSARKIRSRFQTLVAQACDKCSYRDSVKMIADTTEVKLRIRERIIVQITPAFKCAGLWPRSASHWPLPQIPWPHPNIVSEVKTEGFDMLSKECIALQGKNSAMEGDAWVLSFTEAENKLLQVPHLLQSTPPWGNLSNIDACLYWSPADDDDIGRHSVFMFLGRRAAATTGPRGCRRRCLSILKTLRDRHLDLPGNPVTSYVMKTLLLYECEKHPREMEWDESCMGDRINGIFLQLISCLQCRRCPHYFLPNMDLFKGKSPGALENASKQVWRLTRIMLTNSRCLEEL
ncbi:cell fate determining protein mab21l2 [Anopheles darlingi]|uniref:Cell fate determining protein mab21l2 n=1 Tax=Anopheles darlingi TaxID=43151 RepID=W5JSA7_ANODA|nr:cell fate determining protein mab21l2 [Anopheles darlingi]